MGEVRWTHEAVRWLNEIHSYIARDNPAAAARTVQGIYEKAQVLATLPEVGYRYRGSTNRPIRILLYGRGHAGQLRGYADMLKNAAGGPVLGCYVHLPVGGVVVEVEA
jgi:plasmid stabilization system protein ParE